MEESAEVVKPKVRYEMKPPSFFYPNLAQQTEKLEPIMQQQAEKKQRPKSANPRNYATRMRLQKVLAERQAKKAKEQAEKEKNAQSNSEK